MEIMSNLTVDELTMLRYYYLPATERNKVPWRDVLNLADVLTELKVKRLIRPKGRTYVLTARGRDSIIDKATRSAKHEEPMPWMIQSTIMDIAVAIKNVDRALKNSASFDFEREASIAIAVDKCSQNVLVKMLVQRWYFVDTDGAVVWANKVHKE